MCKQISSAAGKKLGAEQTVDKLRCYCRFPPQY